MKGLPSLTKWTFWSSICVIVFWNQRLLKWGVNRPRLTFKVITTSSTGRPLVKRNGWKMCQNVWNNTKDKTVRFHSFIGFIGWPLKKVLHYLLVKQIITKFKDFWDSRYTIYLPLWSQPTEILLNRVMIVFDGQFLHCCLHRK